MSESALEKQLQHEAPAQDPETERTNPPILKSAGQDTESAVYDFKWQFSKVVQSHFYKPTQVHV